MEDITKAVVIHRCYKLTGNYGCFEITKVVRVVGTSDWDEEDWDDEAWSHTGIMLDLTDKGWAFTDAPAGEDWEVERVIGTD